MVIPPSLMVLFDVSPRMAIIIQTSLEYNLSKKSAKCQKLRAFGKYNVPQGLNLTLANFVNMMWSLIII